MPQFRVTVSEEAQNLLDTLVEVFDSSRSNIVEELIIDYVDEYANARKDELEAWIEAQNDEDEEEEDEEE